MEIPINLIDASGANARSVVASEDADNRLAESMAELGQLQSILVARIPNANGHDFRLVAGRRRLAAALALDWDKIEAIELDLAHGFEGSAVIAASAAENMVRAVMHPVDQWRAVKELLDHGYTIDGAAMALGLPLALARRLNLLGNMAPEIIEEIAKEKELPESRHLRLIASASHDAQVKAVRKHRGVMEWAATARLCQIARIPRAFAIFNIETAGIAFEEDLFAEPGADDQWTTSDVAGFLAAQEAAIDAKIAAGKGRYIKAEPSKDGSYALPKGYRHAYGDVPKRFKKDDTRVVFLALRRDGYRMGSVHETLAERIAVADPSARGLGADPDATVPDTPKERGPFTQKLQTEVADIKARALADRLEDTWTDWPVAKKVDPGTLRLAFQSLLLTFCFENISLEYFRDLAAKLVDDEGHYRDLEMHDLINLAARIISRAARFASPKDAGSGPAAEWVALAVGADANLPRFDTPELLAGMSPSFLVQEANSLGMDTTGTGPTLRNRIAGKAEKWSPVAFGAAGPQPYVDDEDDEIGDDPEDEDDA